jgi:precorrin-6A/cobalt-precorrin-6A reductase
MSRHAAEACQDLELPLVQFTRPCWRPTDGDRWLRVPTMTAAAGALGTTPRRVLLTVGGLQLAAFTAAPQHHYVVRTIDPPEIANAMPDHRLILARGPFALEDEIALMQDERIDALVTKNSGGSATEAKLEAARRLRIEVVMVERPETAGVPALESLAAVTRWIEDHRPTP